MRGRKLDIGGGQCALVKGVGHCITLTLLRERKREGEERSEIERRERREKGERGRKRQRGERGKGERGEKGERRHILRQELLWS